MSSDTTLSVLYNSSPRSSRTWKTVRIGTKLTSKRILFLAFGFHMPSTSTFNNVSKNAWTNLPSIRLNHHVVTFCMSQHVSSTSVLNVNSEPFCDLLGSIHPLRHLPSPGNSKMTRRVSCTTRASEYMGAFQLQPNSLTSSKMSLLKRSQCSKEMPICAIVGFARVAVSSPVAT